VVFGGGGLVGGSGEVFPSSMWCRATVVFCGGGTGWVWGKPRESLATNHHRLRKGPAEKAERPSLPKNHRLRKKG